MDYLNTDGGNLPPGATPAPTNLLAGYPSLPSAERAAFRNAIAPRHFFVSAANLVSLLAQAVPGDTAGVTGNGNYIYLLTGANPATPANWINMLTNTAAPSPP